MYNPLSRIIDWYLSPVNGGADGAAGTALGVLPSRPADTDIIAHLIHTGHTPACAHDVRDAFSILFDRDATAFEEILACEYVDSFGLLAR